MKVSISEAARRAGVKRTTIYRKLESGKLSKELGEDGQPCIELSELSRIYPRLVTDPVQRREDRKSTPENSGEITVLRQLVDVLKQDKEHLARQVERLNEQVDRERDVLVMLERERQLTLPPPAPSAPKKRTFWQWFNGR